MYFDGNINDLTKSSKFKIRSFYLDFNEKDFDNVDKKRVLELKLISKNVKFNKLNPKEFDYSKLGKFSNALCHIRMNGKRYGLKSSSEQYLTFMFYIDPNLEAYKICQECNKNDEIKRRIEELFGVYASGLIKTESLFVKKLMDLEDKKLIDEEIDRRIYK